MERLKRALPCLLISVATLISAQTAHGDEGKAQALFQKAEIQFSLENYREALRLYTTAHKLNPQPSFLFNIGLCHHRLGSYEKAVRIFELYIFQEPEAGNRENVQRLIELSRKALKRQRQPQRQRQRQPQPQPVKRVDDVAPAGPSTTHKVLLWTGVGLTVALLATGTVTGQLASDKSEEFNDPATPHDRLQGLKDSGEALSTASIATFAAGGAVALATTIYYFLGYRRAAASRLAVVPIGPGGGIAISGAF